MGRARLSKQKSAAWAEPRRGTAETAGATQTAAGSSGQLPTAPVPGDLRAGRRSSAAYRLPAFYATVRPHVAQIAGALIGEKPPTDLVHDICVEVTLAKPRFRRDCAFSTWMYAIVRHHVHNWIRKERRYRMVIRAAEQARSSPRVLRPDEVMDTFVMVDELSAGFATLTEAQRVCLTLVGAECRSPGEVARLLKITPTAVRMNLHRARSRLRRWLQDGDARGRNLETGG